MRVGARPMWAVQVRAAVVGLLLTMVQDSEQLRWSDPLRGVLDRINHNAAAPSYIGLIMAFPTEEVALLNSGYFVTSSDIPWVDLADNAVHVAIEFIGLLKKGAATVYDH
ncbi:hypothetical protein PanWU01x14_026990 [Parasponia andersonii]|uniref:Uncharacterized protein n=1 Tax=Parasponia andersonii TaxID=3476 RepID=A0A2P5DW89_PARAD|nr:hypothetical protein PanWU01x14_026990 [Parasponia andersonii]